MVFALPWQPFQQCAEGLIAAKGKPVERLVEEREATSNQDNQDQSMHWDDEYGWSFTSLAESELKEPIEDGEMQCSEIEGCSSTQQFSPTKLVEAEDLACIETMQGCETPHSNERPTVVTLGSESVYRRQYTHNYIEDFRALKEFTKTQFSNDTSVLRTELLIDMVDDDAAKADELITMDSFRPANGWDERFVAKTRKYGMADIKMLKDASGQITVRRPRNLEKEKY